MLGLFCHLKVSIQASAYDMPHMSKDANKVVQKLFCGMGTDICDVAITAVSWVTLPRQ